MSANNTIEMNITEINATAIAYDPDAPVANAPIAIIDAENVEVLPPNDEEIQMVKDLDEVEDRIGELYDLGAMDLECYEELGYYFSLIKENKWYKKTERRMEQAPRPPRKRHTAMEKLNDPTRVTCPDCLERVKNLKDHQGRPCCRKDAIKMKLKATKKQLVNETILAATLDLDDTIDRIETYKKQINTLQEELAEEKYEEPINIVHQLDSDGEPDINDYEYIIKTYDKYGEYAGLFELNDEKCWIDENAAREAFEVAIQTEEMGAVELIRIDPNANEDRETMIDEWEDLFSEDEDDEDN